MATKFSLRGARGRRCRRAWPVLVVAAAVAGCSYVPDAINPAEWYKSSSDYIFGDDKKAAEQPDGKTRQVTADRDQPPPGSDQPFPSLSTVPERPQPATSEARRQVAEGLVADRERARYSAEVIQRQGEPVSPLRRDTAPSQPAQSAAPPPPAISSAPPPPAPPAARTSAATPAPGAAPVAPRPAAPAPQSAAASPAPAPAGGGSVEEVYRAYLNQTRPTQAAEAPPPAQPRPQAQAQAEALQLPRLPAPPMPAASPAANSVQTTVDRFDTVFVSSSGVQLGSDSGPSPAAAPTAPAPARAADNSEESIQAYLARPDRRAPGGERVATIVFENGSAQLSGRDRDILGSVAQLYKERGGKIRIVGHASHRTRTMPPVQHQMANYKVSLDRANGVTAELARHGVRRDNIILDAEADSDPIYYEVMPTGEAGNRRTEIYFVGN